MGIHFQVGGHGLRGLLGTYLPGPGVRGKWLRGTKMDA